MPSKSFSELLNTKIQTHWNNVLKLPVLARDENGNYYIKEA
jgi:hypothetical protein